MAKHKARFRRDAVKRFVTLVVLSAMLAGSALGDAKATKAAKKTSKSKQECCAEYKGCCSGTKSDKASKSSSEEKQQEKKGSETPESK
jgi:hypothetical protein